MKRSTDNLATKTRDELIQMVEQLREERETMRQKLLLCQQDIEFLSIGPLGILTRPALDLMIRNGLDLTGKAIIGGDIDNLKAFNERLQIDRSSALLRTAFEQFKIRASDIQIGSIFSGDEFVIICPAKDAPHVAARLQLALHAVGSSATFVISDATNAPAAEQLGRVIAAVQAQKHIRKDCVVRMDTELEAAA